MINQNFLSQKKMKKIISLLIKIYDNKKMILLKKLNNYKRNKKKSKLMNFQVYQKRTNKVVYQ